MHVLVIGAAGFIGSKLVEKIQKQGKLGRDEEVDLLTLADLNKPELPSSESAIRTKVIAFDITDPDSIKNLLAGSPDVIFHLAAVVSGAAESDFDLGYSVNVGGTRRLLESICWRNKDTDKGIGTED